MLTTVPVQLLLLMVATVIAKPSLYYSLPSYYDSFLTASHPNSLIQNLKSQFHSQDELGQYTYGYNDGVSTKVESKTADGVTKGAYSYIDSNGVVQNVNYVSDDSNGFRVTASNLPAVSAETADLVGSAQTVQQTMVQPQQTVEVNQFPNDLQMVDVPADHLVVPKGVQEIEDLEPKTEENVTKPQVPVTRILPQFPALVPPPVTPQVIAYAPPVTPYLSFPRVTSYAYSVPAVSPVYSQYHSQDELGQYSYGYSGGPSSKAESRSLDGVTRGSYSYIDPNGVIQRVSYISDPVNGFRVTGTNFPYLNTYPAYFAPEYPTSVEMNTNQIEDFQRVKQNYDKK